MRYRPENKERIIRQCMEQHEGNPIVTLARFQPSARRNVWMRPVLPQEEL
jgi:hypothetical protein